MSSAEKRSGNIVHESMFVECIYGGVNVPVGGPGSGRVPISDLVSAGTASSSAL